MNEAVSNNAESPSTLKDRRFTAVSWFCASSSFILLGLYLLLGVHIRLGLGHWPQPMFEDYKAPLFQVHMEIVRHVLLGTWFIVGPVWVLCLLIRPLRPEPPRVIAYQLGTFVAGYLAIIAVLTFDPTTFSAWYLD